MVYQKDYSAISTEVETDDKEIATYIFDPEGSGDYDITDKYSDDADEDYEINKWNEWDVAQQQRREAIQEACGNKREREDKYKKLIEARGFTGHLLVDDTHQAIYCYIPKVGCTIWEKMWMILTNLTNETTITEIEDNTPHVNIWKMMLYAQNLSDNELYRKLSNYTKVIVVRHPLERLLSGYFDKISSQYGKLPYQNLVLSYVKQYRQDASITNITWSEYVNFVSDLPALRDAHWQSYEKLCHPCHVDYDVVVKFDTFAEDSEKFLRLVGAPPELHFPNATSRVDEGVIQHYLKQLNEEQIAKLYHYYHRDFELFQYSV